MTAVIVTRGGQVTLLKEVREELNIHEGDTVQLTVRGGVAIITKKDPSVFDKPSYLPKDFSETLLRMRKSAGKRLRKLGMIP